MRKSLVGVAVLGGVLLFIAFRGVVVAQQGQGPAAPPRNPTPANMPLTPLQDLFIRFPLPPGQEAYANIDVGTSADAEDVEWMIAKFKAAGLSDVRSQPYDLVPQWFPQSWDVSVSGNGGPSRPELEKIATNALKLFGATMDLYPNPTPPASDMSSFFRFLPGIDTREFLHYFHTDLETPQTVPWTGLEASTRAYAKIIDDVNKLPLSAFERPEEPTQTAR